jgi:hypothetical protein
VQFDAFESRLPDPERNEGRLLLTDLRPYCENLAELQANMVFPPKWGSSERAERSPLYGLPYFLNPSFLVLRNDFANHLEHSVEGRRIAQGLGDYSWDELIQAATRFAKVSKEVSIFKYAMETLESLNCLFLEILFSPLMTSAKEQISVPGRTIVFLSRLTKPRLSRALTILRQLVSNQPSRQTGGESRSSLHEKTSAALITRHWYSTYREMQADFSESDRTKGFRPIRFPGNV